MADKSVRVKMSITGANDVKKDMKDVSKDADDLNGKDIKPNLGLSGLDKVKSGLKDATDSLMKFGKRDDKAKIGVDGAPSVEKTMDELGDQLTRFSKRIANARVGADADRGKAVLLDFKGRLDKLSESVATPDVDLKGATKALAEAYKLNAELTSLGKRNVVADVTIKFKKDKASEAAAMGSGSKSGGRGGGARGFGGALGGLFGDGGEDIEKEVESGGASMGLDMGHSIMDGLRASTPYLIGGLVLMIASITPAIVPAALGMGVALGGGILLYLKDPAFKKNITGTLNGIMGDLGKDVAPMAKPMEEMFAQLGGFVKQEGPALTAMFSASLPFARLLATVFEQFAKVLIPQLTATFKQLRPEMPELTKAFGEIGLAIVGFIHALGPGIKPAVSVFLGMMTALKFVFIGLGYTCDAVAFIIEKYFAQFAVEIRGLKTGAEAVGKWFSGPFVHFFEDAGTDIKHWWGDVWDWCKARFETFKNAILGAAMDVKNGLISAFHSFVNFFKTLWDDVWNWAKHTFDNFRTNIAGAFSSFYNDAKQWFNKIRSDVESIWKTLWDWCKSTFNSLKSDIVAAWNSLYNDAHEWFSKIRSDVESIWSDLWNWAKRTFDSIKTAIVGAWNDLYNDAHSWFDKIRSDVESIWSNLWNWAKTTFDNIKGDIVSSFEDLYNKATHWFSVIKSAVTRTWSSMWTGLSNAGKAGVNWLIGAINTMGNAWNAVKKFLSLPLPQFTPIKKLSTGGTADGSRWSDTGYAGGGKVPGSGSGDTIPAMLTPGEAVIPTRNVSSHAAQLKSEGVPGFANGGFVGNGSIAHFASGGKAPPQQGTSTNPFGDQKSGGGSFFGSLESFFTLGPAGAILTKTAGSLLKNNLGKFFTPLENELQGLAGGKGADGVQQLAGGMAKDVLSDMVTKLMAAVTQHDESVSGGGDIVNYAKQFVGKVPYVWGGQSPHGWDCEGLVHYIYDHFKIKGVPSGSGNQYHWSKHIPAPGVPGGMVFFLGDGDGGTRGNPGHVGLVSGDGKFINAADQQLGTINSPIKDGPGLVGYGIPPQFTKASFNAKFNASGGGPAAPGLMTIANFLLGKGANRISAAAIAGVTGGEGGGNPESVGSGGGGLMGWTPISSARPIANIITGNKDRDMGVQLTDMWYYIQHEGRGSVNSLLHGSNLEKTADYFSQDWERPKITDSDVHMSIIDSVYSKLGGETNAGGGKKGPTPIAINKHLFNGGWINEPVVGVGLNSGLGYSLGERESEYVTPSSRMNGAGGGGDNYCIYLMDDTDSDAVALRSIKRIRNWKRKHGGQATGIG